MAGIDIYRGNDKQLTEGAINTTARPGAVDPRAQQIDVFPLDAFEFDDPKRIADPIVRLKRPWKWEVQSDIDEAFTDILVLQAMTTFETRYKKSNTLPDTPVGDDPDGWETTISTANPELPVWQSGATRDSYGAIVGTWYTPVRFTGAATIIGALTNDTHQVPTDIDGNFGNFTGAESKLYIYEGAQDATAEFEMSYLASEGVTVDNDYFILHNVVRVTAMSVDAGYVDLIGTRVATVITKSFTISKAKQGDASPAYSLSAETVVALIKPSGAINPSSITFSATYQTGLTAPQPYEAVFRFLVNGVLQFETTTKQSSYSWSGFDDILLYDSPDIILYNTPDIILPFNYTGDDPLAYMTVQIWSPTAGATPDLWLPDVLLDSQSVTFIADWENYTDEILAAVPDYAPRYLGRFGPLEATRYPALYRKGDTWLVYDTDDTPYVRGVYYYDGVATPYRLTDAQSSDAGLIAAALPDILWATKNGFGATNLYGAVTYIENLVSNAIFTDSIQIGQSNVADLDTTLYDLEVAAAADATAKAGAVSDIVPRYRGQLELAPIADLRAGDYYYNTENNITYAYSGTAWDSYAAGTAYAEAVATQAKIDADLLAKNAIAVEFGYADYATMALTIGTTKKTIITGGYINTALIEAEAIVAEKIKAGTITANEIAAGTITASEIAAGTITADEIDVDTLSVKHLNGADGTFSSIYSTDGKIAIFNAPGQSSSAYGILYGAASLVDPSVGQKATMISGGIYKVRYTGTYWAIYGRLNVELDDTRPFEAIAYNSAGAQSTRLAVVQDPGYVNGSWVNYNALELETQNGYVNLLGSEDHRFGRGYVMVLNNNASRTDAAYQANFYDYRGSYATISYVKNVMNYWEDFSQTLTTTFTDVWQFSYQGARAVEIILRFNTDPGAFIRINSNDLGTRYHVYDDFEGRWASGSGCFRIYNVGGLLRLQVRKVDMEGLSIPSTVAVTVRGISNISV